MSSFLKFGMTHVCQYLETLPLAEEEAGGGVSRAWPGAMCRDLPSHV